MWTPTLCLPRRRTGASGSLHWVRGTRRNHATLSDHDLAYAAVRSGGDRAALRASGATARTRAAGTVRPVLGQIRRRLPDPRAEPGRSARDRAERSGAYIQII